MPNSAVWLPNIPARNFTYNVRKQTTVNIVNVQIVEYFYYKHIPGLQSFPNWDLHKDLAAMLKENKLQIQ